MRCAKHKDKGATAPPGKYEKGEKSMDEKTKELIAIGASISGHCQPCLTFHVDQAKHLGIGEDEIKEKNSFNTIKIYDPAMCCSSGVCGPSVDPVLAQFAGALNFVSGQPGIRVERYNLGQQPQAFVENAQVKALLGDGGVERLPFIFINDQLWSQGRYPSREELFQALGINTETALFLNTVPLEKDPGCGGGEKGCC
jgi:AhpD family alkylhydroperoxidase